MGLFGIQGNPLTWAGDVGNFAGDKFREASGTGMRMGTQLGQTLGFIPPDKMAAQQAEAAAFDTSKTDEDRLKMMALVAQLEAQARGEGPSVAQNQLQQATDQNVRQAAQMGINLGAGGPRAANLKAILDTQANTQQGSANQSAILKATEQLQAQQQLQALLGGLRGQDIGVMGAMQGAQQQANLFNTNMRSQYDQMNAAAAQAAQERFQKYALGALGAASGGVGTLASSGMLSGLPNPFKSGGGSSGGGTSGAAGSAGSGIGSAGGGGGGGGGMWHGGPVVPGKAAVMGDSGTNDTVPAMLSPGEIVLPRSVAQAEDAPDRAAEFVKALKRKKRAA